MLVFSLMLAQLDDFALTVGQVSVREQSSMWKGHSASNVW